MSKKEKTAFARMGGLALAKDKSHMRAIGLKGAKARWKGHKKVVKK